MLGLALGVASLIVVLSVMNGFAEELRARILAVVPHAFVVGENSSVSDWQQLAERIESVQGVEAVAPFVASKVMLASHGNIVGAAVTAIVPSLEKSVSTVSEHMVYGRLDDLDEQRFGLVLGSLLSNSLGAKLGDKVEMILPRIQVTPLGVFPKRKHFTVVGTFEVGAQLDSTQAFIALSAGQKLFGLGQKVHGVRIRMDDLFAAPKRLAEIQTAAGEGSVATDWSMTQGSLFQSIKMEKIMIAVLLMCVIAVAAFNIVSTLSMAVAEKRGDIAVLRTMGASANSVVAIFMIQGVAVATVGIIVGATLGVVLATNLSQIASVLEAALGLQVFDPKVYFISRIPSVVHTGDVLASCGGALLLSIVAAAYPAWRASRIAPAEVLRYAL